jgi:hypothetical protein
MKLLRLTRLLSLTFVTLSFLPLLGITALPAYADTTAFVRVIHASPDIGTADVFVDGVKLLSSFQFGAVTGYVRVPTGPHLIQIAAIGKGPGAAVLTQTLSVGAGGPYTVAAIGTKATKLALQVFTDNNLVVSGKAKLSVYNLSPDAGSLSVATGGQELINGLPYQQASDYEVMPAGSYTFDVAPSQESTTMQLPATLPANTVTSIFSVGLLNGNPKFQLVTAQVPGTPNWPGTGSDPNLVQTDSPSPNLWLVWTLVLALVGASGVVVGWFVVRDPVSRLRHYRQQ